MCPQKKPSRCAMRFSMPGRAILAITANAALMPKAPALLKANEDTNPYVGEPGKRHYENEVRIETVYPANLESKLLMALFLAHPYEEVAYDLYTLTNQHQQVGSGMIGELEEAMDEEEFLFDDQRKNAGPCDKAYCVYRQKR